ncbi:hypothetical protein VM98_34820, partial [Streptomyces rubellomurinus subsp. indigoferus]
ALDIAGLETWLPLTSGDGVLPAPKDTVLDPARLAEPITGSRARVLQRTPSLWQAPLAPDPAARARVPALAGADAVPAGLGPARRLRAADETTVHRPAEPSELAPAWLLRVPTGQPRNRGAA